MEIDKLRHQLDEDITKTKALLKHWQTWEAEYEGFKEELEELGEHVTMEAMVCEATSVISFTLTHDQTASAERFDGVFLTKEGTICS